MIKAIKNTYSGMSQDLSKSKTRNEFYFEGRNIRIVSSNESTTGSITNEKGNELLLSIPNININFTTKTILYDTKSLNYTTDEINDLYDIPSYEYGEQIIIGNCKTNNGFIIATTNNNGLDCIWYLTDNFNLTLLYLRNLNFSEDNPLQILNNYENNKIDKIYWIDGKEQMKFLNIYHSIDNNDLEELIDLSSTSLNVTSEVNLINPIIEDISYGGTHTSGMIQYAYSYYKINGSQSSLSPLSELISLGKSSIEGGDVNETVGSIPKIIINEIDSRFTNLRLYAVKYTSFNQLPSISLIADRDITGFNTFSYYDDGRIIQNITLEEFIFLSGKIVIPKHIESKDNRLFLFNYKERAYNLNYKNNNLDVRAYSFPINSTTTTIYDNLTDYNETTQTPTGNETTIDTNYINGLTYLEENHDAINGYYHLNKYQYNSSVIGGEGPFLKYEISRSTINKEDFHDYKFLKDDELYRIGIQFYNKYGIKSLPKWIADFVTSSNSNSISNLNGQYAGIKITFKPQFYIWLNTQSNFLDENGNYDEFLKPVGFKLLRADRTLSDRTIVSQGLINGMISQSMTTGYPTDVNTNINIANEGLKMPWLMRRFDDYLHPMTSCNTYERLDKQLYTVGSGLLYSHPQWNGLEVNSNNEIFASNSRRNSVYQFNQLMQFRSPELIFETINNIESNNLKVIGSIDNDYNATKARWEEWEFGNFGAYEFIYNALSKYDVKATGANGDTSFGARGLIGPWWTSEDFDHRKRANTAQFYRSYNGTFRKNTSTNNIYKIYGKPEISEVNANSKKYNNDDDLLYTNTLTPLISDELTTGGFDVAITTVLSDGTRSAVFALGEDSILTKDRPTIEELFQDSSMFGTIPGQVGGIQNNFQLNQVVSFQSDLTGLDFTDQYVGVLENGNVYYNNNLDSIITVYNFLNVVYVFPDLASYDAEATTTVDDWTGIRIAIVDGISNIIYEVIDQNTSLAGLNDTGETFDFLEEGSSSINLYVNNDIELYSLDTTGLPIGYVVGVISSGLTYEWNSTTWIENGTFTVDDSYTGGVGLICEFTIDEKLKYIGNLYGGNSYESKTKTIYVEASNYFKFNTSLTTQIFTINNPGDTFVQSYSIMNIGKNGNNPWNDGLRITELMTVRLETTVNQFKRNDESIVNWESSFSPSQGDYHSYNRVYSQNPNLIKSQDISYELKINEDFNTGILATNLKRPGEIIDNWTNISINDNMFLEGKYGSINSVIKHNDSIYTFQNNAIAQIVINPKVQVQASDNIGLELGTGAVLYDFKYLSTNSGTLNKWGTLSANNGIYYYDTLNNGIYLFSGSVNKLSEIKGLHSYLQKNIDPSIISNNNHVIKKGITIGFDYLNNDIYFTFLQEDLSDTISFNEFKNEFVSLHDFNPSFYFNKGDIFLTTNNLNNKIYQHKEGIYNIYYDEYKPSYVTLLSSPENGDISCTFNNIEFKSEVYNNDEDQYNKTINKIHVWNEYQDSYEKPLILNSNISRKFRTWKLNIPRNNNNRDRIKNSWTFIKLIFENEENNKIILHDTIIYYTI